MKSHKKLWGSRHQSSSWEENHLSSSADPRKKGDRIKPGRWQSEELGWGFGAVGVRTRWIKKQNICIDSAEVEMNASCSASISGAPVCSSWGKQCPDQWSSIRAASGRTDYRARHPIRPDSQVVLNIRPLFLCWLKTHEFHRTTAGTWEPEKKGMGNMQHSVIISWWYSEENFWYFQLKH